MKALQYLIVYYLNNINKEVLQHETVLWMRGVERRTISSLKMRFLASLGMTVSEGLVMTQYEHLINTLA